MATTFQTSQVTGISSTGTTLGYQSTFDPLSTSSVASMPSNPVSKGGPVTGTVLDNQPAPAKQATDSVFASLGSSVSAPMGIIQTVTVIATALCSM